MEKYHSHVLEMLPCISPVPVVLHTIEPPRKTKIGLRNRGFEKSKIESTEIKAKGNENWFEKTGFHCITGS